MWDYVLHLFFRCEVGSGALETMVPLGIPVKYETFGPGPGSKFNFKRSDVQASEASLADLAPFIYE
jgi:hypothetical protein